MAAPQSGSSRAAQLAQLRDAEEDVRLAMARLTLLRAQLEGGRPVATVYEPIGMSCLSAIVRGCGKCVAEPLQAAETCRASMLGPPPPQPIVVKQPEPAWLFALLEFCGSMSYKLSCGMCGLPPQLKLADTPGARKSTTVSNQHEVLPSLTGCLQGDEDIDLELMAKGVRPMILALEALGAWTFIAVREMNSNLEKIEQCDTVAKSPSGAQKLMIEVLDAEVKAGIHGAGGVLAQPSGAEGVLWLFRFLTLWREMWRDPRPATFKEAIDLAYQKSICAYHSWLVQNTFNVAVAAVPTWTEARDNLDGLDVAGEEGLMKSIAALDPVLGRMEAALKARDLWDVRQV